MFVEQPSLPFRNSHEPLLPSIYAGTIECMVPKAKIYGDVNLRELKMIQIPFPLTKRFIVANHYSHTLPSSVKVSIGFFLNEQLVCNVVYGCAVGRKVAEWLKVKNDNLLELVRLFSIDGMPKNTESYCIGQSFAFLRKYYPEYKYLISYADPNHGHCGYIYQATNWRYIGVQRKILKQRRVFIDGEEVHTRTLNAKHGSSADQLLYQIYGDRVRIMGAMKKHVYIMCLGTKRERAEWYNLFPSMPYPKAVDDKIIGQVG